MSQAAVFTSTISQDLLDWLRGYSKNTKKTKRAILEEAIKEYQIKIKKQKMKEDFIRASQDPEMLQIAEEGMGDYLKIIEQFENEAKRNLLR